jgi:drug/metabolite transporter (DMT)-like permease
VALPGRRRHQLERRLPQRPGVARVGQVELVQPVITIASSALLLREPVGPLAFVAALAVVACVFATQRAR